ncbi:MAG: DUF4340 domain-containing protein [Phycisphaerales bacterium]|nr:DUF4340 domain-containing protein [Phycisphaerales bacterium]
MSWRVTITTLVIAAVLAVLAIFTLDHRQDGFNSSVAGPLETSERFSIPEINRLELIQDESRWTFVREENGWWQTEPFRAPIADRHVLSLAERANDLRVIDRFASSQELSDASLHLDPPKASLVFSWTGGDRQFDLGRRGVAGRGYLQIDEKPMILVVNQGLHEAVLDSDPATWREPRLFPGFDIESGRVSRFVGNQEMRLDRSTGTWRITEPIETRINMEAMEAYVIELARAKSANVILDEPESLSAFGLDTPIAAIEVVDGDDVSRRLLIGDRVGGRTQDRYVMIEGIPSVLRLEAKTVVALLEDPINLIDSRASGISRAGVKAIVIRGSGEDIRLERDLDRWIAMSHDAVEVPRDRVEALMDLIFDAPAMEVALVETYPQELEAGSITLIGYDQRPMDTVRVLRETPEDGLRWGLENGDLVVRIHPSAITVPLSATDWGLRSRDP